MTMHCMFMLKIILSNWMVFIVYHLLSFGLDILYPIMTQLRCEQNDFQVITQCNYKPAVPASCANLDDVTVSCCKQLLYSKTFIVLFFILKILYS